MTPQSSSGAQNPPPSPPGGPSYGAPTKSTVPPPFHGEGLGTGWAPQAAPLQTLTLPRGVDLGILVIASGALLTLIGFLCGAAAAGAAGSAYQAWLEGFFVITGIGIFLILGGWLTRTVMTARQDSR